MELCALLVLLLLAIFSATYADTYAHADLIRLLGSGQGDILYLHSTQAKLIFAFVYCPLRPLSQPENQTFKLLRVKCIRIRAFQAPSKRISHSRCTGPYRAP
jgi:hypothetical protein